MIGKAPTLLCRGLLALLLLLPLSAGAVDLTLFSTPFRLDITDSLFLGYHSLSEPLSPGPGQPLGNPLNPFSGIDRLSSITALRRGDGSLGSDIVFSGNNRLPLTRSDTGQAYMDLFHRFNISLSGWRIQAGLRLDTSLFINPPEPLDLNNLSAGGCGEACTSRFINRWVSPTFFEKAYITYADRRWEATLGDFYAVFGRGLVLSVRKVDELGIDTTILGGKVAYNSGRFKVIGLAGVSNIQNVDESTGRFESDPFDVILGLRAEVRLWNKLIVGIHAAGGVLSHIEARQNPDAPVDYGTGRIGYGVSIDAPRLLPFLDLYVEGAGLELLRQQNASGYALYGSATAYAGPVSFLLEGKYYHQFELWYGSTSRPEFANIFYNLPPTVEPLLTELEDPQTQVAGGRLSVTYRVNSRLTLLASDGLFTQDTYASLVTHAETIRDVNGGFQVRWQEGLSHLFAEGGYRQEHNTQDDEDFKRTGLLDWDFTQALPRRLSIESQGRALFRYRKAGPDTPAEPNWTEGNAFLALKWAPYLVASFGLEWSTRQQVESENGKNYIEYGLFPNGLIQYNITTRTSVKLFAGGLRGGLKCISGICRIYPEFRGVRLEVVLRF